MNNCGRKSATADFLLFVSEKAIAIFRAITFFIILRCSLILEPKARQTKLRLQFIENFA